MKYDLYESEMVDEINPSDYRVYCDLDGVLVDFEKFSLEHIGYLPNENKKQFWKDVGSFIDEHGGFFDMMPPMSDAGELWSYISKFNPWILTATSISEAERAAFQKKKWVRKNLKIPESRVLTVMSAKDKMKYAKSEFDILIDDREKAIEPWEAAGGIGILHTDASSTIQQLIDIGLR